MANPFWAKVPFCDFIRHFRKLSDQQIVDDVKKSMDALEDGDSEGDCFGCLMVRISRERILMRGDINRANALAGHEKHGHEIKAPVQLAPEQKKEMPRPRREFPSVEELYDFCSETGLDSGLAREWFELTSERGGKARDGKEITNWKGAVTNYVNARLRNIKRDTK